VREAEFFMSMTLGDHDMIVAFRSGDARVFDEVVAEHRAELLRHAARSAPDPATAEDLVQEAYARAYRAFATLPDDSRIRPWLHQILRNVCIDDAHRRRRERDKQERFVVDPLRCAVEPGPEERLGLDCDEAALGAAMAALPRTHRDALVQRVVDGFDYDEIAAREGVSETNARARVSRARAALRRALQGVAAVPVACYLLIRRPGRSALAAPPDPTGASAATTVAASPATVDTASRIATSFAPVMEAATNVATGASHTVPLLTKAAVGIGAVATVSLATGPEQPMEIPPAVTVEVTADALGDSVDEPVVVIAPAPADQPAAAPLAQPAPAPATTEPPTTVALTTTTTAGLDQDAAPIVAAASPGPDADTEPSPEPTTVPDSTVATTVVTTAPPTTLPPTTVPPTTLPPLTGGSLQATVSASPSGPRLDLSGPVSLTAGGATSSGSLSGRIGVGDPDPAGLRRIDGFVTLSLGTGTLELRLAGHATSAETTAPAVPPTTLTMSGVYRASGATGQLVTSGSFSGSLSGGALTLSLAP
jgi:RNA polymerase sigma factor (sigma-70 family)